MNKLLQIYKQYKNTNINIDVENNNLLELMNYKSQFDNRVKALKDKNNILDIEIKKYNELINNQHIRITEYNDYLSKYAEEHGNIIDRLTFYTKDMPIIGNIFAIFIGFPYIFLMTFLSPFSDRFFNEDLYLTDSQKLKRKELDDVITEFYNKVDDFERKKEKNLRKRSFVEKQLLKISYAINIKKEILNNISNPNNYKVKLYYIRLMRENQFYYKIGITKYDVAMRYSTDSKSDNIDKIIFEIPYKNAEKMEQHIIELNHSFRLLKTSGQYYPPMSNKTLLDSGNSEIFVKDVFNIKFLRELEYDWLDEDLITNHRSQ